MKVVSINNYQNSPKYKNNKNTNQNVVSTPLSKQNNVSFTGVSWNSLDLISEITRHRLIKMQNPDIKRFGFERIAGYEDIKASLATFLIDAIKLEKAGNNVDIPGSILIFGPTETGKTTLNHAITEETGCIVSKIDCGLRITDKTRNEFMENLKKEAQKAEKRFNQDRTRTILNIGNLGMVGKESNILKPFEQFIKTCSERYHCTIIGGTNHPSKLGVNLEDANIFPFRIALNPPTQNDTVAIFKHHLEGKTSGHVNHDLLANTLIKTGEERGGMYSPAQIENIIDNSAKSGTSGISEQDILDCIVNGNFERRIESQSPAITWDKIQKFHEEEEIYITNHIL